MRSAARIGMMALLAGCIGPASMGQFGEEESIECAATSRTPVLPEDTVEIGYVDELQAVRVGDMLELAAGTFDETMEWSDDSETSVTVLLEGAGSPEVVTYELVGSGEETAANPDFCPTKLEFAVDVTFTTGDGRMSDGFVAAGAVGTGEVYIEHRITAPGGSIDVEALAQEGVDVEPDVIRVSIRGLVEPASFSGSLLPQPLEGDGDAQALGTWPAGAFD